MDIVVFTVVEIGNIDICKKSLSLNTYEKILNQLYNRKKFCMSTSSFGVYKINRNV